MFSTGVTVPVMDYVLFKCIRDVDVKTLILRVKLNR